MNETSACCGLFCKSCGVYIATEKNDIPELERISRLMKTTIDEIPCNGCRSNVLSPHCRNCNFKNCAQEKGILNCEECPDFPCNPLMEFQKKMPHRAELFESAIYRKENGIDSWLEKMRSDYSCPECATINSPYYISCKSCGNTPGNDFIKRNISILKK